MAATKTRTPTFEKRATAHGTYFKSFASRATLRAYLRDCDTSLLKLASIGGEQEQGFEQAFSSLAYQYAKDKAPRLLDFIVGFQLVDRNEDNTKAVGLFGFKVGDTWLYGPVFFLNGDLKGHELLYIKKQDTFVPMKENWVNHLISRKPHVLGEPSEQNTAQLGGLMPNIQRLGRPPGSSKYGSDAPEPVDVAEWARPALPLIAALATRQARALYPDVVKTAGELDITAVVGRPFQAALVPYAARFDLGTFLGSDFGLLKAARDLYDTYPLVRQGFDRFYGADFFLKTAQAMKAEAASIVPVPARKKKSAPIKSASAYLIPEDVPLDPRAGLEVIALDIDEDAPGGIKENKKELTDEERERLLKDTILIKDERGGDQVSVAYNTQVKLELLNPSETGLYEILEKPGSFDEMLVIANPHSGRGRENFMVVLRKGDTRNWLNTDRSNLWAKANACPVRSDFVKYVSGLNGVDSLKTGGIYVAIHENGSGTIPFKVREDYGNGRYKVSFEDYCRWENRNTTRPKIDRPQDWTVGYSNWDATVHINERAGTKLRSLNGVLSIPDSFKIVKVEDPPKPRKDEDDLTCCSPMWFGGTDGGGSKKQPIVPGNLVDVQLMLHKQANVLKVHDTGCEVWVNSRLGHERMTKRAALVCLVRDHGLREYQARQMLKEAAAAAIHNRAISYLVKYAYGYGGGLQPGPGAPAFPEPETGVEMNGPNAVSSIYPQEEFMPVDEMSSQNTDPGIYDPFYQPDQGAMQVAQQAAAGGQKEVFDTSMIGGMLKSVRQDSLVDRYLGDLMKALDKLGRILFMFYWHQEEFEERYGRHDIPELEDSLRNAFEVLGDVCLFLMEKTVAGGAGLNISGVGNGSEPNIDEAARN